MHAHARSSRVSHVVRSHPAAGRGVAVAAGATLDWDSAPHARWARRGHAANRSNRSGTGWPPPTRARHGPAPGRTAARPLRVEAAALSRPPRRLPGHRARGPSRGERRPARPVRRRFSSPSSSVLALSILVGGACSRARTSAKAVAIGTAPCASGAAITVALWALWVCQVHVSGLVGLLGTFLIAVCTTVFYGVFFWAIYLALEPFVRRHWPQTLVSWTTLLSGRVRDPVVGRDVLFGVGARCGDCSAHQRHRACLRQPTLAADRAPAGLRALRTNSVHAVYAMRTALFVFFLLFLLRVLLRNQWAGGAGVRRRFSRC